MRLKPLLLLLPALLIAGRGTVSAQDNPGPQGIPTEVYYLMPAFSDGMIYFDGMTPAKGQLNICALDNTLRFLDRDGHELAASDESKILRVRIDTVTFLRAQGVYYRLYPVARDCGVALRRDVQILKDVKGAYGASTQTSSVKSYDVIYADGVAYNIGADKEYPFKMSETPCLYSGDRIYSLNKKGLRKLFPERKAEIDAWFAEGNALSESIPELVTQLRVWAQ